METINSQNITKIENQVDAKIESISNQVDTNTENQVDTNKFTDDPSQSRTIRNIRNTLKFTLKEKYNITDENVIDELLKIHGLHKDNFDFVGNIEKIIKVKLNDVSIDDNSNKNDKTIMGMLKEVTAPVDKAVGFDMLYQTMREIYGKKEAKRLSGEMYDLSLAISDSTKLLVCYCWALDASKIVMEGRQFGALYSGKPKRVDSYISALSETIHQMSNHLAGALAIGSYFMDIAHLMIFREKVSLFKLKHDKKTRKRIENEFQKFIHSVNHTSRLGTESPFTNLSIFDRPKLESLLSKENMGWYFDSDTIHQLYKNTNVNFFGKLKNNIEKIRLKKVNLKYAVEYIIELQNIYMNFFDKGDPSKNGLPYRFPVLSVNISKKVNGDIKIADEKFLDDFVNNYDFYRYNIFSSEGTKIASCCFDGKQKILSRLKNENPSLKSFEELYNNPDKTHYRVLNTGFWSKCKIIRIDGKNRYLYKVITENNKEMIVTDNHINLTYDGEKETKNLSKNDYLMFNNSIINEIKENSNNLTYEQGVLIGAYLGDGSGAFNEKTKQISLSLNEKKYKKLLPIIEKSLLDIGEDINKISLTKIYHNVYPVLINSIKVKKFISNYVEGDSAYTKNINLKCLFESKEFRQGIIDGLYFTDGGNNNRIYSISENLINSLEIIITSLGKQSIIDKTDRTDEKIIIREEEFKRNYPVFCIRYYDNNTRSSMKDVYKVKLNSIYFKIKSIEKLDLKNEFVYCFEMENQDNPYFILPNGIITHNCRLINDVEMLELASSVNSFGGSSISLGSHRVLTINLNRIANEAKELSDYYTILEKRIEDTAKILKAHKELIRITTDKGLQMFIKMGWINMNRMFSTFGILGYVEAVETLEKRFGKTDYDILEKILVFLNDKVSEYSKKYSIIGNIEQIPAESMAHRLPKADRLIFGDKIEYKLYANQFIPLWDDVTLWERMEKDGKYNKLLTGGGIVHAQIGENITSKQAKKIIVFSIKSGCEHFALNSVWCECVDGHVYMGKFDKCPKCNKEIKSYYTRVIGFFTPVSSWNYNRREHDFPNRTFVNID